MWKPDVGKYIRAIASKLTVERLDFVLILMFALSIIAVGFDLLLGNLQTIIVVVPVAILTSFAVGVRYGITSAQKYLRDESVREAMALWDEINKRMNPPEQKP